MLKKNKLKQNIKSCHNNRIKFKIQIRVNKLLSLVETTNEKSFSDKDRTLEGN